MLDRLNIFGVLNVIIDAGKTTVDIYNKEYEVKYKEDESPLTLADEKSNEIIINSLKEKSGLDLPILSEESKEISYNIRKEWSYFWLVDPLDGTKEFIKKNGEFTVNIALIDKNIPVFGVVYAPVLDVLYFGMANMGSFKIESASKYSEEQLKNNLRQLPLFDNNIYTIAVSRSHLTDETEVYMENLKKKYGKIKTLAIGSSLKICYVAEGIVNEYPRFGPTMEWDTAAAHAVLKYAGGYLYEFETKEELRYNKQNLLNPFFVAAMQKE